MFVINLILLICLTVNADLSYSTCSISEEELYLYECDIRYKTIKAFIKKITSIFNKKQLKFFQISSMIDDKWSLIVDDGILTKDSYEFNKVKLYKINSHALLLLENVNYSEQKFSANEVTLTPHCHSKFCWKIIVDNVSYDEEMILMQNNKIVLFDFIKIPCIDFYMSNVPSSGFLIPFFGKNVDCLYFSTPYYLYLKTMDFIIEPMFGQNYGLNIKQRLLLSDFKIDFSYIKFARSEGKFVIKFERKNFDCDF